MRIAFLTQCKPCRELGGGRAQFELAPELDALGCVCTVLGPEDLLACPGAPSDIQVAFEHWLQGPGREFDVVDYDHNYLLPSRASLSAKVLYVARSVLFIPFSPLLLADDYATLRLKMAIRLRRLFAWQGPPQPVAPLHLLIPALRCADAVNVSNSRDVALAIALGVSAEKVLCQPYAVARGLRTGLEAVPLARREPEFVFVGTFDARKGGFALPEVFARLRMEFPTARLTLLGTGGSVSEAVVRRRFPADLRRDVNVVPLFPNDELPVRLAGAAVGLFPSRHEGFPFAVLEQLHAGVPVAAYDAPGVCDQLPPGWRTAPGDPKALAACAARLMCGVLAGEAVGAEARALAARFQIEVLAADTRKKYAALLKGKK